VWSKRTGLVAADQAPPHLPDAFPAQPPVRAQPPGLTTRLFAERSFLTAGSPAGGEAHPPPLLKDRDALRDHVERL
jgi:hypothetical protein